MNKEIKKRLKLELFMLFFLVLFVSSSYAADNYPWINTGLYENIKQPGSYSVAEANFVADHYDIAIAHLQDRSQIIKQRNSNIDILPFTGLAYISTSEQLNIPEFFNLNTQYTASEKESIYLHYKCDVIIGSTLYKGCNLENAETGRCTGTSAQGCSASSASWIYQSRVPDPDPTYRASGWLMANYNDVYEDYSVWRIKRIFNYYNSLAQPDGVFWDNILYLGSISIDKTIEYWGLQDIWGQEHQRNRDYNNYFLSVKQGVENELNKPLIWMGNVNGMYWIRGYPEVGPYTNWVLNNLNYFTPESWVSPISRGEQNMPSWDYECYDMREAWEYSFDRHNYIGVMTYNHIFEGSYENPDERTRVFSIAKYYLVKNSYLYYFYSENGGGENIMDSEWNILADINLGMPRINPSGVVDFNGNTNTNRFFDWNNKNTQPICQYYDLSNVVMARYFDNGLILARWKGNRCSNSGPECNSYVDPKIYNLNNPYNSFYYVIQSDGNIPLNPVSSVTLKTNEAVLLLNVCPDGEVSNVCGCKGSILEEGDFCGKNETPINNTSSYCGDGVCDKNESCETCQQDCKICNITYQCNDGIDNDGDEHIDYPLDPGCSGLNDDSEEEPIMPQNISCSHECKAGELICSTNLTYLRCSFYDQDPCLEWSSEIGCSEGYSCERNKGCVFIEEEEDRTVIDEFIEGDASLSLYAMVALALILIILMIWMIFRRLMYNYNRW